ncbi:MAG: RelA/SpoT domain-containing protein [Chloroflexota bacterium]|nr:RelA/SpoT domain-containing protein [Chloroflexota bacterium]MDE2960153.1 RelA/SpoT domain-containing protein [Chloroflexota bacterium]
MTMQFNDAEIDALGERLRQGAAPANHAERAMYRIYQRNLTSLRQSLERELQDLAPDAEIGSRTKRLETVVAKLQRRPDLALSQVTDLAGCRIIVSSNAEQRAIVSQLLAIYYVQQVDDKSEHPKFGYRAVHLDIRYRGQLMEVQVQTHNQHLWQTVSELAAGYDISIKYGGGNPEISRSLQELSELAWRCDLEGTNLPDDDIDRVRDVILSAYSG